MSCITEASQSVASVSSVRDRTSDSAESKPPSLKPDTECHGSVGSGQQQSTNVTSCLLQTVGDDISPAAAAVDDDDGDDDDEEHCSVVSSSLLTLRNKTDSKQLAHHMPFDAVSEQSHCKIVSEDDLSVFFASPVNASSLSAKLKAAPKRKAKCVPELTKSHSCELVCEQHETNAANDIECSQQCVQLPLHDAVTVSVDKPGVSVDVVTSRYDIIYKSAVYQPCSAPQLSTTSGSMTRQSDLVHQLTVSTVHHDTSSSSLQTSDHSMQPVAVSFLPSSKIGSIVPSKNHSACSSSLMSSALSQLSVTVSSSATLLDKQSSCGASSILSKSEKLLTVPVKQSAANSRRFLYPSATHVYRPLVNNVFECSSSDLSLLQQKRSSSFLYRAPDIIQSGGMMAQSKVEQHMKKTVSLAASPVVSCGSYTVGVASDRNTTGDSSSMPEECAVVEIEKKLSQHVINKQPVTTSPQPLSAPIQSILGVSGGSQWMCDFSGQTSPRMSNRTTLCDVGVQTSDWKFALEDDSNVCKQPLVIDAAVQTIPLSSTNCTCSKLSHLHQNQSKSLWRANFWPDHDLHDIADANDMSCSGKAETVSTSDRLLSAHNTAHISTAVINGNRSTGTINQAASPPITFADYDGQVPQCVISNASLFNLGKLHRDKHETLSAEKDLSRLTMVTDNHVQVTNDVSPKNTNVSLPTSFSTGFVSAGGKPLNVKLSSKLNARKLLDDVRCNEDDSSKNVTVTAHFSNVDCLPSSSRHKRMKVIQDLISIATGAFDCTDKSLNQTSEESESSCYAGGKQSSSSLLSLHSTDQVANVMFSTGKQFTDSEFTVSARAEQNAEYSGYNCAGMLHKSHSKDTISNGFRPFKAPRISTMLSKRTVNKNKSTEADDGHLSVTSEARSNNRESENRVSVSVAGSELLSDLTNTQRAEVVDASLVLLNSAEMFATQSGDDNVNGRLGLPGEMSVSEAPGISGDCPLNPNIVTNIDNANVPSRCSLVPTIMASDTDNACESVLTEEVQHCADEPDLEAVIVDVNGSQSALRASVVFTKSEVSMVNANADNTTSKSNSFAFFSAKGNRISVSEKTLHTIRQKWNSDSDFIQMHNIEQHLLSVYDSVPSRSEPDMSVSDVAECSGKSNVSVDAGVAEIKPAPAGSLQSSRYGETDVDEVACCKICSCVNPSCRCAAENQDSSVLSPERKNADKSCSFAFFSAKGSKISVSEKTLHAVRQNWNSRLNSETENQYSLQFLKQKDAENLTSKSSSFAFFSGNGSKITISEKTLDTVRQNWNSHLNLANSTVTESEPMTKSAADCEQLTHLHSSQMEVEEMHIDGDASDTGYTCSRCENSSRNKNAYDSNENNVMSVSAVGVHLGTLGVVTKVSGSDRKNIHTVSNVAVTSVDSDIVSPDKSYVPSHGRSEHVSFVRAAQPRLPLKSINYCSIAEAGDVKHLTDRHFFTTTLCTVPESKCYTV